MRIANAAILRRATSEQQSREIALTRFPPQRAAFARSRAAALPEPVVIRAIAARPCSAARPAASSQTMTAAL